ncbi:MAG: exo-alpha-sialidase [Gemmatales bacterium]
MRSVSWGTVLFTLASVAALAASWRPVRAEPRFLIQKESPSLSPAHYESHMAWRPEGVKQIHGSSVVALPGHELFMVYYGGTSESTLDVKLYQTWFRNGKWETPSLLLTPQDVGESTNRYTRRVGNSSLFRDAQGRLHLFFVSVGYFGWSCSSLNQMTSLDDGKTWSPIKRLLTTPLINISTLVRSPAVPLENGGFLLPIYYELTNKFPETLEFDAKGELVRKVRMTGEHGVIQACLVPTSSTEALAYERNRLFEEDPHLKYQKTSDGGRTWTAPAALSVKNLDSPVAAAQLAPNLFIMVYNPTFDREIMTLAASKNGIDWHDIKTLGQDKITRSQPDIEFSYPTLVVQGDTIDLVYTFHRRGIFHARFNTSWVKEQMRD